MGVIFFVVPFAFSYYGYKRADRFETRYGRGPGGSSPMGWGIVCFLLGLGGWLILYFAENSTRKKIERERQSYSPGAYGAPAYTDHRFAAPVPYQPAPRLAPPAPPAGQWGPPPAPPAGQWGPPPAPPQNWAPPAQTGPPGPPRPNVGGSDFLPRK